MRFFSIALLIGRYDLGRCPILARLAPKRTQQRPQCRRPQWFVEQGVTCGAGQERQFGAVVGTDQRRTARRAARFTQPTQQLDAVDAVPEMVVGQYRVDFHLRADLRSLGTVAGLEHLHTPLSEQRLHTVEDRAVVVDAQHTQTAQPDRVGCGTLRSDALWPPGLDVARYPYTERGAAPRAAGEGQRVVHQPGEPVADRQAKPQALLAPGGSLLAATELVVHALALVFGNTGPGVIHRDFELASAPSATNHDTAAFGVAQRVRQVILDDPPQQHAIAAHHFMTADDA